MTIGVIGAGASGIIAALKASEKNNVVILEKNDKIGKKILVTGNGRCNLWNQSIFSKDIKDLYSCDNYDVLNNIFTYSKETYNYLIKELNIAVRNNDGYIYPYSNTAQSIRTLLENKISNNDNIDVIYNFEVTNIDSIGDKVKVSNNNNEYFEFDKVIVSVGSKASNLGTNSLENILGDKVLINKEMPALVPISILDRLVSSWNGVRVNSKLSLFVNGELIKSDIGELQLTDYGISGIPSFNISGLINRHKKDLIELEIDFMPEEEYSEEKLMDLFTNLFKTENTLEEVLETYFNYKLLFVILSSAGLEKNTICSKLYPTEIANLVDTIKHFKVAFDSTLGFDRAQVSTGGISLNEINNNLELKNIPNVFVTGEILDIDGICGGYNLANAFITGYIAGSKIND